MNNNNSITWFDHLATEIILDIFDYLSCNDIIYTFFYFNQRLNSILLHYQHCSNNFRSLITNFNFWQNNLPIIGSHIQCLIINSIDLSFSLNLFPNLKSIIISSPIFIDYKQISLILESEQFNKLNSFKIQSEIFNKVMSYEYSKKCEKFLLKKIFNNENSLKIFQCLSELYFCNLKEIDNLVSNINIHSLSLKSADFISAFSFFKYTPNLKIFNLITTTSYLHDKLDKDLDLSKIKLEKLYLTLKIDASDSLIGGRQFRLLINLIKQFSSSLIYLSLNLSVIKIGTYNDIQFNGIQLQQQLLESMIELKQFHLYANLWDYLLDIKSILSTFENQFWFDHNWSIGMHGHYLYTLPFHFDKLYDFIDFDDIKSNNSNILNYPWTWYHVTSINFSSSSKLNLNLIKQLKIKMPNLISITFNSFSFQYFETTKDSSISDDKLQKIDITLDSVTTVQFEDESMKDIKQWILDILPNLKHLVLSGTTQFFPQVDKRIERLKILNLYSLSDMLKLGYIYFPNLLHVEIQFFLDSELNLDNYASYCVMEMLKSFKHSKTLMIHFYWRSEDGWYHISIADLSKMIAKLDINEILKTFEMKHFYNFLQFIKKEQ
ncbi:unnamed protein product [Rotaria sordida]|uniref:Uncharacterized protein n=3 Tax=Rotaria sordida TaxID=392033 RepID=A0A819BTM6_9BILA|nr:unnamed protein product [Rotaria sordida]CAF3807517.1 unnamed protein product [Rotaria sordida]